MYLVLILHYLDTEEESALCCSPLIFIIGRFFCLSFFPPSFSHTFALSCLFEEKLNFTKCFVGVAMGGFIHHDHAETAGLFCSVDLKSSGDVGSAEALIRQVNWEKNRCLN